MILACSEPLGGQLVPGVFALSDLVYIDGPFSGGGAFNRGGAKDGADSSILDGSNLRLWISGDPFFTLVSEGCLRLRINSWR